MFFCIIHPTFFKDNIILVPSPKPILHYRKKLQKPPLAGYFKRRVLLSFLGSVRDLRPVTKIIVLQHSHNPVISFKCTTVLVPAKKTTVNQQQLTNSHSGISFSMVTSHLCIYGAELTTHIDGSNASVRHSN